MRLLSKCRKSHRPPGYKVSKDVDVQGGTASGSLMIGESSGGAAQFPRNYHALVSPT